MNKLSRYNSFILEKQFQSIIDDIFRLVESEGRWTSDNTYEWDLEQDNSIKGKLKSFLSKLTKDEIKSYYYKFVDNLKSLPENIRRKMIVGYTAIFLGFISATSLFPSDAEAETMPDKLKKEVLSALEVEKEVEIKSSFDDAQGIVKQVEAGYSSDRGDTGNWIKVPGGKRFVGTNHGISAPILAEYLGRLPKKEDMQNLSYETALKIYKTEYWDKYNLSEFTNQSIANIIYDGVVNQGRNGTRSVLRKALNENGIEITDDDDPFDVEWIQKTNKLDQVKLFESIKKFREDRYREAPTFKRHGEGWLNRLYSFEYQNTNDMV